MIDSGDDAHTVVTRRGLAQQNDEATLREYIEQAIAANPKAAADYRSGKEAALNALVGGVMKASKGTANIPVVREMLKQRLAAPD
jgi:aspartyl-tRNA(Asn)/glutamyl-tRNA(Gln) amidotransferase subunit B